MPTGTTNAKALAALLSMAMTDQVPKTTSPRTRKLKRTRSGLLMNLFRVILASHSPPIRLCSSTSQGQRRSRAPNHLLAVTLQLSRPPRATTATAAKTVVTTAVVIDPSRVRRAHSLVSAVGHRQVTKATSLPRIASAKPLRERRKMTTLETRRPPAAATPPTAVPATVLPRSPPPDAGRRPHGAQPSGACENSGAPCLTPTRPTHRATASCGPVLPSSTARAWARVLPQHTHQRRRLPSGRRQHRAKNQLLS